MRGGDPASAIDVWVDGGGDQLREADRELIGAPRGLHVDNRGIGFGGAGQVDGSDGLSWPHWDGLIWLHSGGWGSGCDGLIWPRWGSGRCGLALLAGVGQAVGVAAGLDDVGAEGEPVDDRGA